MNVAIMKLAAMLRLFTTEIALAVLMTCSSGSGQPPS